MGEEVYAFMSVVKLSSLNFMLWLDAALELIEHLRAMGETNALIQRGNVSLT